MEPDEGDKQEAAAHDQADDDGGASKPVLKRPAATLSSDGDGNGMAIEEQGLKWHLELNADAPPDLST